MKVRLQADNRFGEDGPQSGALGECVEIRLIDDDYWAYVIIDRPKPPALYIVKLDDLMSTNTENTESYGTTHL